MNRFRVAKIANLEKWIILDTHQWDSSGKWAEIEGTANIDKSELEKETKRLNRGIGLEKYGLPNKGMK